MNLNPRKLNKAYRELLATARWQSLAAAGARPQRLLWASTGAKDASAPDTLHVEALAARHTINTFPEHTLIAFSRLGHVDTTLPTDGGYVEAVLEDLRCEGIDDEALAVRLQQEGVAALASSWSKLITQIAKKGSTRSHSVARYSA